MRNQTNNPKIDHAPRLVRNTASSDTVPLLAGGSLHQTDTRQIHVVPSIVEDSGRFAWWISGENQKAVLSQPYQPRTDNVAGLVELGQSHTVANPEVFGLPSMLTDPEPHNPSTAAAKLGRKAISRKTMALIEAGNNTEPQKKFHDLSAYSIGLLTNTATGGWRKDMSILTEGWDNIYTTYPSRNLPLFRYSPSSGNTSLVPNPTLPAANIGVTNGAALTAATPAMSNLYPWSNYSLIMGYTQPCTFQAASASWASLKSYATSYKNFSRSSGEVTSPLVWNAIAKQRATDIRVRDIFDHKHTQRLHPQIARFQLIVYARAIVDPGWNRVGATRYQMQIMYVPFFTLWNPYNLTLQHTISGTTGLGVLPEGQRLLSTKNFLGFGWRRSLPGAMAIVDRADPRFTNPDNVPLNQYRLLTPGNIQTLDWPNNYANLADNALPENVTKFGSNGRWLDSRT